MEKKSDNKSKKIDAMADAFEKKQFSISEVKKIKKTRRRSPQIGEQNAEVYTFRAPPSFKKRIKKRAESDATSESDVIRSALDSYLKETS